MAFVRASIGVGVTLIITVCLRLDERRVAKLLSETHPLNVVTVLLHALCHRPGDEQSDASLGSDMDESMGDDPDDGGGRDTPRDDGDDGGLAPPIMDAPPLPPPFGSPSAQNTPPAAPNPATPIAPEAPGTPGTDTPAEEYFEHVEQGRCWGCFRITPRHHEGGSVTSYQASCPFHKRNQKTGCNIELSVSPTLPREAALRCLLLWCNLATGFTRQCDHSRFKPTLSDLPLDCILKAQCIAVKPVRGAVRTDEELDSAGQDEQVDPALKRLRPADADAGHSRSSDEGAAEADSDESGGDEGAAESDSDDEGGGDKGGAEADAEEGGGDEGADEDTSDSNSSSSSSGRSS